MCSSDLISSGGLRQLELVQAVGFGRCQASQDVDAAVANYRKPPSLERSTGIECVKSFQAAQGRLLDRVLRIMTIAKNRTRVRGRLPEQRLNQERVLALRTHGLTQLLEQLEQLQQLIVKYDAYRDDGQEVN